MTQPPPPPTPTADLRLLVVDDEEQILELLELTLTLKGYRVLTARSGPEALQVSRQHGLDIIVMDVLMSPWDGFETVRQLQAEHHHQAQGRDVKAQPFPPVVFLSGLNRPESLPLSSETLLHDYLVKPFRPSQLVEAIERLWRLHSRRA